MERDELVDRFPEAASTVLSGVGAASIALGAALLVVPLPTYLGTPLPYGYRAALAALGFVGGGLHLLAGRWARDRRDLFRAVAVTLVGMVVLQVSAPLDLLAIALLGLSRDRFDGD